MRAEECGGGGRLLRSIPFGQAGTKAISAVPEPDIFTSISGILIEMSFWDTSPEVVARLRGTARVPEERKVCWDTASRDASASYLTPITLPNYPTGTRLDSPPRCYTFDLQVTGSGLL